MNKGRDYYLDPRVAERYDAEATGLPGDVEFYLGLAKAAEPPVLELACGTGRVAIPIARAGVEVVGLDLSVAMLDIARAKSEGLENLTLVHGDMADFDLQRRFGLVFIPYRSFLHLMTVEEQKSCLRCVLDHLLPGGRLALNIFNPSIVMIATWLGPKQGGLQRFRDVPLRGGGRDVGWETREYRISTQEVHEEIIDEELTDEGAVVSRVYRQMRMRYVFRYEMQYLLELAGFEVEALYGGFRGEPFSDTSTEMVWVARKLLARPI